MGLAASQARALLLVARKSDLEYRSQCLTQRKMVLSQQTEQLAKEYAQKISNRRLKFVYNLDQANNKPVTEDLTYYSLDAGNTKFAGTYRVMDAQGNIVVASINDIPKKKVQIPVYVQVEKKTDKDGNETYEPVEVKKDVYSETSNEELGKNHGGTEEGKEEYLPVYVDSYNASTKSVEKVMIQNEKGEPIIDAKITKQDGTSYSVFTKKSGAKSNDASYDNYELSSYANSAKKYTHSSVPDYIKTTEDKSGDSNYKVFTYTYVEQEREQASDGYYYTDDGRRYVVCPEIAKPTYFQNGLRNGAFVLQQESTVDKLDDLGNKIGEVSSWNTTPWQGIDTVQDVLYTEDDALAQSEYEAKTACIKAQDQMLDLEIKQIETQHKAVETEMDSVKKIIEGNIDKTFKIFA